MEMIEIMQTTVLDNTIKYAKKKDHLQINVDKIWQWVF